MPINHRGFTLIEIIIFIVIVSIAATAISIFFAQNVQHSPEPLLRQKAVAFAQQYLDQMQVVRWDETTPIGGGTATTQSSPGIDAGESCSLGSVDDFDDFDCFTNVDLGDSFSLSISVNNGSGTWSGVPGNHYKQAQVEVTTPLNETLSLNIYRANY